MAVRTGCYSTSLMVLVVLYTTAGGEQEANQQPSSSKLGSQEYASGETISPTPTAHVTFESEPSSLLLSSSRSLASDEPVSSSFEAYYLPSFTNEPVLSPIVEGTSALTTTGYTQSLPLLPSIVDDILVASLRVGGDAWIASSVSLTPTLTEAQASLTNAKPSATESIADDLSILMVSTVVDTVVVSTIMHSSSAATVASSPTPTIGSSNSLIASTISELNTSRTLQDDFTSATNSSYLFSSPASTSTTDNLTTEAVTRSGTHFEDVNSGNEVISVYSIDGIYSVNILMPCLVGLSLIVLAYKLIQRAWNYNNKFVINKKRSIHIRDLRKLRENGNQFSENTRDPELNHPVTAPSNKGSSSHIMSGSGELQEIYVENPAFSFEDIETTQL